MTENNEEENPVAVEMYDQMLDIFENKQTDDVLSALQTVVSTILRSASLTKEAALVNVAIFATGVSMSIEEADKSGDCAWNERRH